MTAPYEKMDDSSPDALPGSDPAAVPGSETAEARPPDDDIGAAPDGPAAGTVHASDAEEPWGDTAVAVLGRIHDQLAAGNARAAARERVIDRLHEENQLLKAGERQSLLLPVVTDLYRLRDDLLKQAGDLPPDFGADRASALLQSYAQSVELSLERAGVVPVRPRIGEPFDARVHRASGTVPASEAGADATIADVVRDGYRDTVSGRVLTAATVRVARWMPPPQ